jgi:hypothetical protein
MNLRDKFSITLNAFTLSVTIGSAKHLAIGEVGSSDEDAAIAQIQKLASKAIRKGQTAIYGDGSKEWIDFREARVDGDYDWHADGNRVLVQRIHIQVTADGTRTESTLSPVFRTPA